MNATQPLFCISMPALGLQRRRALYLLLAVCLCLSLVPNMGWTAQGAEETVDWHYTLRPDESIQDVAQRCCGSLEYVDRILSHNHVDLRKELQPGSRIRIPVRWLVKQPAVVEVTAVTGSAQDDTGRALVSGDTLGIGQTVETAADSHIVLTFADGSTLELNAESHLRFDLLSSYGDTGMVDTLLRLQRGRGLIRVKENSGRTRFRVSTPSGIAAVRGTSFRLESGERSLLETTDGSVSFAQQATATRAANELVIDAAFGVVAKAQGMTKEALLSPPSQLSVNSRAPQEPRLSWQKDPQAAGYVVDLYRVEANAVVPLDSQFSSSNDFVLAGYAPGKYQVNLRSVAASGLQGMDVTTQVDVAAVPEPEPAKARPWWLLLLLPLLAV